MQLNISLSVAEFLELLARLRTTEQLQWESQIMATLQDIQAAVERERTVSQSIVALVNGLAQQLRDAIANNDPDAMQQIVDQLSGNSDQLAQAVIANTPSEGQPNA